MQNFIVFDIDKTLYRGTLAVDFIEALLDSECIDPLLPEVCKYRKLPSDSDVATRDTALIAALRAAQASGATDFAQYRSIGRQVGSACAKRICKKPRQLYDEQYQLGRTTIAISTSPFAVVKPFCDELRFDIVIAPMASQVGRSLGTHSLIPSASRSKGEWLKSIVELYGFTFENSIGIGDSVTDVSVLEQVKRPIAYEPDSELETVATQKGWEIWHE